MFAKEIFASRRAALLKSGLKGIAFFPANDEASLNYPDNTYRYRQDSNFAYFFGLDTPDLVGVIDFESGEEILFGREITIDDIIWCGNLPSLTEQGEMIAVKQTRDINGFGEYLRDAVNKGRQIHILPPYRGDMKIKLAKWFNTDIDSISKYVSQELITEVVKLREIKSDVEIEDMEKAANTAYFMHTTAMKMCKPGVIEQEIAGAVEGIAISMVRPCITTIITTCFKKEEWWYATLALRQRIITLPTSHVPFL